jgi:hypothetical protein
MPPTVIVNMMTAVHSGSIGQSISFPDVCKTPAPPAPPIPIPYPNIAMSSDASSEASKVTADGSKLMVKGSNIMMSTGDEAGALMGVVSNKIKGKAEFVNYSFDVKADGKNICRLTDPMTQNMGSPANAFGPAELQAPQVAMSPEKEACDKVQEKADAQENNPETQWGESGVHASHHAAFTNVAKDHNVVIKIRATNKDCGPWIGKKHRPKPHAVFTGKTISAKNVNLVKRWNAKERRRIRERWMRSQEAIEILPLVEKARVKKGKSYDYSYFHGIVMMLEQPETGNGPDDGMPLRSRKNKFGGLASDCGVNYKNKWITGDYDLMDLLFNEQGCKRVDQHSDAFTAIKLELNAGMQWDGIQHGPQAQWVPSHEPGFSSATDFPTEIDGWVNSSNPTPPTVTVETPKGTRKMPAYDKNLTVVYPKGVVHLPADEDAKNALICMGCQNKKKE